MTDHAGARYRPSLRWDIPAPLSLGTREMLAESLDAVFTDEDTPRARPTIRTDVQVVVVDLATSFAMIAHFSAAPAAERTRVADVIFDVNDALAFAGLPAATGPWEIVVGAAEVRQGYKALDLDDPCWSAAD